MPFHIQPIREFLVRPALPDSLSRLAELAYNLLWSWEPIVRSVFRRLDPVLWRDCGYNPVLMLGRVPQATLQRAAGDPRYLAVYRGARRTPEIACPPNWTKLAAAVSLILWFGVGVAGRAIGFQ